MIGWVKVHGGTHYCELCRTFVDATRAAPVWKHYVSSTTSTSCACDGCAKQA